MSPSADFPASGSGACGRRPGADPWRSPECSLARTPGPGGAAEARGDEAERREYRIFAGWVGSEVIIAASVALTGGPRTATMAWFAIPIVTLSARFSVRGIVVGVVTTLGLLVAVAFGV